MNFIELFYSDQALSCKKVHSMLQKISERREDIVLMTKNVEFDEVEKEANKRDIPGVPTTIINGKTIIRGVPNSENQILSKME